MLKSLPAPLRGILALCCYALNTLFWTTPLIAVALLKLIFPVAAWRRRCSRLLTAMANNWIGVNNGTQRLFGDPRWDVRGTESLTHQDWYLVVANHQSWVDILVLQRIFYRKIPFLKFFIKKELFWFPFLGLAWWALDFPFMKRYSRAFLQRHPHLKGKDIEITRRACEKFKATPTAIMNFVEGTRFTRAKHLRQQSPYANLLRTKAGGIAFVLGAMGPHLSRVLDVTIVYPKGVKSFWAFLCGDIEEIKVRVNALPISADILGDYTADDAFRQNFHQWLNTLWQRKDRLIQELQPHP